MHVRMVEGVSPYRSAFRQAGEKLCGDALMGLCHAVSTTLLLLQCLEVYVGLMFGSWLGQRSEGSSKF